MVVYDGGGASAAWTPESLVATDHWRRRRDRVRRRDGRSSASPSSSPDPRSSRRNQHRRHAWQRAVPLGRALIRDQRPAPEGEGKLGAMHARGGKAATVGSVEEKEGRRPCRASAHAARSSPGRGDDSAGTGTATGDAPERDGRALAARGIPGVGRSSTTAALRLRRRRLSRRRRPIQGVFDAIGFGGAAGGHRRRRPLPPTRDRADGSGTAGTRSNEPSLWGGR